jgi:hypothetical protein
MRLFLHHDDSVFSPREVVTKTKSKSGSVRKEINVLSSIGFLEKKRNRTYGFTGKGKKKKEVIKETISYKINSAFPHNVALKELLFDFESVDKKELAARFKHVGRIKLFIVSGIFLGEKDSRVDVLLVGEALKRNKAEKVFETLSSELGRDLAYSIMDSEEFEYRFKMYDKFIKDILDLPHEKVIDKFTKKTTE